MRLQCSDVFATAGFSYQTFGNFLQIGCGGSAYGVSTPSRGRHVIDSQTLNVLSEHMGDLLPAIQGTSGLEVHRSMRNSLQLGLAPLNPVSRAEFEALRLLLRYMREHLDSIGPRLTELERLQREGATCQCLPIRALPGHSAVIAGSLDSAASVNRRIAP